MKLPQAAKKVFQGKIYSVYQRKQKLFDGSFSIFECVQRPFSVWVIAISEGKVFLARQQQPHIWVFFSTFGWLLDQGESFLQAAQRELLEESWFVSTNMIEFYHYIDPAWTQSWEKMIYIAYDCKQIENQHLDAGEKIEIISMTVDEYIDLVIYQKYEWNPIRFRDRELREKIIEIYLQWNIESFMRLLERKDFA